MKGIPFGPGGSDRKSLSCEHRLKIYQTPNAKTIEMVTATMEAMATTTNRKAREIVCGTML
jgi:hypothetical protein